MTTKFPQNIAQLKTSTTDVLSTNTKKQFQIRLSKFVTVEKFMVHELKVNALGIKSVFILNLFKMFFFTIFVASELIVLSGYPKLMLELSVECTVLCEPYCYTLYVHCCNVNKYMTIFY